MFGSTKVLSTFVRSQRNPRVRDNFLRDSAFNILGQVVPVLIGIGAIPICLSLVGEEQFAVLSLMWAAVGSFAFFDLGVGVAATHYTARALGQTGVEEVGRIIGSSLALNVTVGIVVMAVGQVVVPFFVSLVTQSAILADPMTTAFRILLLSAPSILLSSSLRGALEAGGFFAVTNGVKVVSNSLLMVIPPVAFLLGGSIVDVAIWLTVSRIVTSVVLLQCVSSRIVHLNALSWTKKGIGQILGYSAWVGMSNLLNPMINYADRIIIPMFLSIGALAYYTAPYEIVSRVAIIPFGMVVALVPRLSAAQTFEAGMERMFQRPLFILLLILTPLVSILTFFPGEILSIWLGVDFANHSGDVVPILGLAFFFNSLAFLGLAPLLGLGRPDLKAKLDWILVILAIGLAWMLVPQWGSIGAAVAKVIIFFVDVIVLFIFVKRLMAGSSTPLFSKQLLMAISAGLSVTTLGVVLHSTSVGLLVRLSLFILALLTFYLTFHRALSGLSALSMLLKQSVRNSNNGD